MTICLQPQNAQEVSYVLFWLPGANNYLYYLESSSALLSIIIFFVKLFMFEQCMTHHNQWA